jgi:NADPH:quinone reductase-like Zn-dependent oxidoreductase
MKAIIATKSGPPEVLQLKEIDTPQPAEHEVLIRVHAATVTRGDIMLRKLHPLLALPMQLMGIKKKKVPGHEFAGEVVAVGSEVESFKIGDKAFGTTTGLSAGANAEYLNLPENPKQNVLERIPEKLSYDEAAALPVGGMTALYLLQKGNIQKGQKVLVNGASGSVGSYALQLAKVRFGAQVTGVCSTKNVKLVKSLGADEVIDYTQEEFTRNGRKYDVILDTVGNLNAGQCKGSLNPNGKFLTIRSMTREDPQALMLLADLLASKKIKVVIDKRFPLELVADAHRYVESGHKVGNVVILIGQN